MIRFLTGLLAELLQIAHASWKNINWLYYMQWADIKLN